MSARGSRTRWPRTTTASHPAWRRVPKHRGLARSPRGGARWTRPHDPFRLADVLLARPHGGRGVRRQPDAAPQGVPEAPLLDRLPSAAQLGRGGSAACGARARRVHVTRPIGVARTELGGAPRGWMPRPVTECHSGSWPWGDTAAPLARPPPRHGACSRGGDLYARSVTARVIEVYERAGGIQTMKGIVTSLLA